MMNLERFEAMCGEQGVKVGHGVIPAARKNVQAQDNCYAPTAMLSAVAWAGDILRTDPDVTFINQEIIEPAGLAESDVTVHSLINILNASRRPVAGIPGRIFSGENIPWTPACSEAETKVIKMCERMEGPYTSRLAAHVFVDEAREPILVRKVVGERSALALQAISINGIPYPAGSLVGVRQDLLASRLSNVHYPTVEVWGLPAVDGAAFLRLSAYALPPEQQDQFGFKDRERVKDFSLDRIRGIVRKQISNAMAIEVPAYAN